MISIIIEIILYISTIFIFSTLIYSLLKFRAKSYINPFFIIAGWIFAYLSLPAIFVEDYFLFEGWKIDTLAIDFSNIIVICFNLVFGLSLFVFSRIKVKNTNTLIKSRLYKIVWNLLVGLLIYIIIYQIFTGQFLTLENYGIEGQITRFHERNLCYFTLGFTILYFFETKKYYAFLPNLLVALLELSKGGRSMAFCMFTSIFLCYTVKNNKLGIWGFLFFGLLAKFIQDIRSTFFVHNEMPFPINYMGETTGVYAILPRLILNDDFIGKATWVDWSASFLGTLIRPLRDFCYSNCIFSGHQIMKCLSTYGRASNIVINSVFYSYYCIPITILFLFLATYICYYLVNKVDLIKSIIISSYFIVFSRLIIREGLTINMCLGIMVFFTYFVPIILLNKFYNKYWRKKYV